MNMVNVARAVRAAIVVTVMAMGCSKPESSNPRTPSPESRVPNPAVDPYHAEIERFRQAREAKLTSDTGWLTIAGLHFLTQPETTVGSDAANDVVLPGGTPSRVGTFVLAKNGHVSVRLEPRVVVSLLDGKPFAGGPIKSDGEGPPDRLVFGDVQVWVHQSGERPAIRIRDKNNPLRKTFTGMKWYPVNEAYRVEGTYQPYDTPKTVQVPNLLGDIDTMTSPGTVSFSLGGKTMRMAAVTENDTEFWFIFRDLTSSDETYPAARFLYTPRPVDGKVPLDFNKAENPPCAFNPYSTCPLPPQENRLQVRVEAGEKIYQRH
jgi:uncharacterized protein (DUF1684 family)